MKEKKITVKNLISFEKVKKQISNALNEDGENLKTALLELISKLEDSESEIGEEELKEAVMSFLSEMKEDEIPEAVANAIAKVANKAQSAVKGDLPQKVKNEIAGAILRSNKSEIQN